ncbi:MAG: hypothetical protein O3A00_04775 [Planctomycetota bacterium]|nr:hypothetical protein [Planctomycetota bacterium]
MSRRKQDHELGFGSDSFLDIIANIVGILIILIVVAGVKVSRAPVSKPEAKTQSLPAETPQTAPRSPEIIASLPVAPVIEHPLPLPPAPAVFAPPKPTAAPQPTPELVLQVQKLGADVVRLRDVQSLRGQQVKQAVLQVGSLKRRLAELDKTLQTQSAVLTSSTDDLSAAQSTTAALNRRLADLQTDVQDAEARGPKVETLRHLVTPMARTVDGDELHFHLAANKVTVVPLDEMLAVLKGRIGRQKEWLAKFNTHRGVIGPMNGFKMHYVVSRMRASVVDELKYGSGSIRIGLSEWRLEPEAVLPAETFADAQRPDSVFRRTLEVAAKDTTLTFWVYPDGFSIFRELQDYAHRRGFTVAGRPLPNGIEIAGSPAGSRSTGQ